VKVYRQKPNEFLHVPLSGPMLNPDGRKYSVLLLPSAFVRIASYTDVNRVFGQIMIEGMQGALNAPGLPGGVGGNIASEIFKYTIDEVVGIVKEQAIRALAEMINREDIVNACGYFTNRNGGPLQAAAILCAFGGGKPLRYHNRVQAESNFNKPRFYVNQTVKLTVSYGLPIPFIGGDAEISVIGA
jgi:hypothetical protein